MYTYTQTPAERRDHTSQDVDTASLTPTERCTESDTPQAVDATRGLRITSRTPKEPSIDVICRPRDDNTVRVLMVQSWKVRQSQVKLLRPLRSGLTAEYPATPKHIWNLWLRGYAATRLRSYTTR